MTKEWIFKKDKHNRLICGNLDDRNYLLIFYGPKVAVYLKPNWSYLVEFIEECFPTKPKIIETDKENLALYAFNKGNEFSEEKTSFREDILSRTIDYYVTRELCAKLPDILPANFILPEGHRLIAEYPSSRNPKIIYHIVADTNNNLYCDCEGYGYRKTCSHIDMTKIEYRNYKEK